MALIGYIQVTRRCNQACRFCSNPPLDAELAPAEGRRQIDELAARGYAAVVLTGGEPTLSPHLEGLVRHAARRGVAPRIVTNGREIGAGKADLPRLVRAGLRHLHISLYSHRPEVVAALTCTPDSLAMALRALEAAGRTGGRLAVDVNIVINRYNADHLDGTARFVLDRFPFVRHFVFNNLDPEMSRVQENRDTVPALWEMEVALHRALGLIEERGGTFRVERVPLCYMAEHARASTETRKIVKGEERTTFFLDAKGVVRQTSFLHDKAPACRVCTLDPICAGLDGVGKGYFLEELSPVFVDPGPIIGRIRRSA